MANIQVIAEIEPITGSLAPLVDSVYVKGGCRAAATITARDAIGVARRSEGMLVHTLHNRTIYVLSADLTTWSVVQRLGREGFDLNDDDDTSTIYVAADGDDETGDGAALETAFATPQRAIDEIPNHARGTYNVLVGAGSYEVPYVDKGSPGKLVINVIGDRTAPDVGPFAAVSGSLVSGKAAQYDTNVGSYGATVTNTSHWAESEHVEVLAHAVMASTTPNIRTPGENGFQIIAIHPFTTEFAVSVDFRPSVSAAGGTTLRLVGIKITNSPFTLRGWQLRGCVFTASAYIDSVQCNAVFGSAVAVNSYLGQGSNTINGLCVSTLSIANGSVRFNGVCQATATAQIQLDFAGDGRQARLMLNKADFDGTATPVVATASPGAAVILDDSVTVAASVAQVFELAMATLYRHGGTITGALNSASPLVSLTNGAQAYGLKAACDGTLTNAGAGGLVKLGTLTAQTFASLPTTDLVTLSGAT